jgi:hypothetical protein
MSARGGALKGGRIAVLIMEVVGTAVLYAGVIAVLLSEVAKAAGYRI